MGKYQKVKDEDNIFYDQEENMYRYRMHCPNCGKLTGCRCFMELEKAKEAAEDGLNFACSSICSLISFAEYNDEKDIIDLIHELKVLSIYDRFLLYVRRVAVWGLDYPNFYISTCEKIIWWLNRFKVDTNRVNIERLIHDKLTNEQARYILDKLDPDFDYPGGEACE